MTCRRAKLLIKFYGLIQYIYFLFCLTSSSVALTGENVCRWGNETICCANFEERNNTCVECRPGFRGDDCSSTCHDGYYGQRCLMQCRCDVSEYCHPVCGCVSILTKPLDDTQMIDNVKSNEHYSNITDITQTLSMESCFHSTKTTASASNAEISIDNGLNLFHRKVLPVFLVALSVVLFACLLLFFGISYRKYHTKMKEGHNDVHNELYISQEGDRENNPVSREGTSGDPLYGSCEDPCYSTLTLRVNYGPTHPCNQNGSTEDVNPYGYTYKGEGNVGKLQGTNDNTLYLDKDSVQTHMSSIQGQYEDPWRNDCNNSLLRHSSQRRFDLMPVDESERAMRGKEYGPYELASNN